MRSLIIVLAFCASLSVAAEERVVPVELRGPVLLINGQETRLGVAHWNAPEKNWSTVGEMLKTTLPPPNASGLRPDVTLAVSLDMRAPWGGLKCVLMAASALGVGHLTVQWKGQAAVPMDLPGAEAKGDVVDLPLFVGKAVAQTENGGQRIDCRPGLVKGLVQQLPKATVQVTAETSMPAVQVVGVLMALREAKAADVAYLPVKEITAQETADRKETKDAVDRSFGGLDRALGGKKD